MIIGHDVGMIAQVKPVVGIDYLNGRGQKWRDED